MPDPASPSQQALAQAVAQAHAEDVAQARALLLAGVQAADARWVPRNATVEALLVLAHELAAPCTARRYDA